MADRYWVGGTATWDGTAGTKWSATSGGAGGQTVPTAADNVFFDANSGSAVVTIGTGRVAKTLTCTGFTGTLGNSTNSYTVSGNVTLGSGMTYSAGQLVINATATIITAGKTLTGGLGVSASSSTVTLGDALTATANFAGQALQIVAGTFATANFSMTTSEINASGSSTRVINLGSSAITVNGTGGCDFSGTNITVNAGTSTIQGTVTPWPFKGGGNTFYNVINSVDNSGIITITGANTFNNLTINASSTARKRLLLTDNQTVNGTLNVAGASATSRVFVFSDAIGTARNITAATVLANDCDFRDITIAGAASPISPTRAGDCGGNTNITFPAPKTVYRVGTNTTWAGSSSWATTSGGAGSDSNFPLAQDTAIINQDTALTGTLSLGTYNIGALDASARTTGITLNHNASADRYGSYTLGSGVTVSGTSAQTFSGRGTMVFTSAGKTITFPITVDTPGGTFRLGDAYNASLSVTLLRGTFDAYNYNLTCTQFASASSNTRALTMGSGLWTLSGTDTVWDMATTTGLTFDKGTANIVLSNTSTTARTFAGGGLTYNNLTIGGASGTSTLTISGSNTFADLSSTKTVAHTISFTGGTTQTLSTFSVTGTLGNVVTIGSTNTTQVTLEKPSTWFVGANSTDGGNNVGLIFSAGGGIDYLSISRITGISTAVANGLLFGSNF